MKVLAFFLMLVAAPALAGEITSAQCANVACDTVIIVRDGVTYFVPATNTNPDYRDVIASGITIQPME